MEKLQDPGLSVPGIFSSRGAEMLETLRSPPQYLLEANQHGNPVW